MILVKAQKDLDYWKKKLLSILKGDVVEKSLKEILYPGQIIKSEDILDLLQKARGYAIGTIRTWQGKKYKKLSSGKWMRTYTGTDERGERQAVRNVMNKIQKASTMEELSKIVSENMQRFKDESGKTLPIVKEFMSSARGTEAGKKEQPEKPMTQKEIGEKAKLDNQKRIAEEFEVSVEKVQQLSDEYRKKYPRRKVNIDTVRNLVKEDLSNETEKIKSKLSETKKKLEQLKVSEKKEALKQKVEEQRAKAEEERAKKEGLTEARKEAAQGKDVDSQFAGLKDTAERAYMGTSFSPEKRGKDTIESYKGELKSDLEKIPEDRQDAYMSQYVSKFRNWMEKKGRVISPMITGPANFPVARNRKANDAEMKAYEEFQNFRDKAGKAEDRKRVLSPEEDIDVAIEKVDKLIVAQELMKESNKIIRKKNLTDEQKVSQMAELGIKESTAKGALVPDYMGRQGFPSYAMTNNNAKIKNAKIKIETMKQRIKAKESFEPIAFKGGEIAIDNDRVTITHDEKPSREVIDKIKARGFRWSRNYGAWSRKHTARAVSDAKELMGIQKSMKIIVRNHK